METTYRTAYVYVREAFAGVLKETDSGYSFIYDEKYIEDAEIYREKGTNRSKFFRGEIDKYTWVEYGSSYLPSDINAAYLWAEPHEAPTPHI